MPCGTTPPCAVLFTGTDTALAKRLIAGAIAKAADRRGPNAWGGDEAGWKAAAGRADGQLVAEDARSEKDVRAAGRISRAHLPVWL